MARRGTAKLLIAAIAIVAGIAAAFLPKQWIEQAAGIAPDGGSGLLELLFVVVPIASGVVLAAHAVLTERRPWSQPQKASARPIDRP